MIGVTVKKVDGLHFKDLCMFEVTVKEKIGL